jgi:uncharacterized protein
VTDRKGPALSEEVLIDDGLFSGDGDSVVLHASRCADCDATVFPAQQSCPRCTGDRMQPEALPNQGVLWSYTIQRFRPKSPYDGPDDFEPYGVGYVQLGDRVLVEGRLTENDPQRLHIGQPMKVVADRYTVKTDGAPVVTFAFQPID